MQNPEGNSEGVADARASGDRLRQVLGRFRGAFIAVIVFGVVANVLMLTLPFYMLNLFTRVMTSRSVETLVMLTIAAVAGLGLFAVVDAVRLRLLARIGIALDHGVSGYILNASLRNVAAGTGGSTTQNLRDLSEVRTFLSSPAIVAIFDAPFLPAYIWIIYLFHPVMGHLALAGSVVLFGVALLNERMTRGPMKEATSAAAKTYQMADGYLRSADAVQSMGMRPWVVQAWQESHTRDLAAVGRASSLATSMSSLAKFLRFMLQVAIYATGAYLFLEQSMTPGAMIAAGILVGRALQPVEMAIGSWRNLVSARGAYGRLKEFLAKNARPASGTELPAPQGRLSVEKLVVAAPGGGERLILRGVGFELEAGDMLGIIGPSGAGKTTLARSIVGLLSPKAGTVRLDGAELSQWNPDLLGRYVGYLPQDVQLLAGTVAQNIARMIQGAPSEAVIAAAKLAGVHEMILRLPQGYDTELGDGGLGLSAGQRQHIGLARALYGNPALLVLDEPNSNMDGTSEQALLQALAAVDAAGTTVIVVSHRLNILGGADKLLVLRDGTVEMFGPRTEVLARLSRGTQAGAPQVTAQQPRLPYPQYSGIKKGSVTPLRADTGA